MDVVRKICFLLLASLCFSGCYTLKSAYNQMSILANRESYDSILARKDLTEEQRRKLLLAQDIREFALKNLKLHSNGNYTQVTWLDRPYVTWAVSASDPWRIKPYEWSFPIVGKVPYLGFFNLKDAETEEKEMAAKGYDTYLRGVSAYSTLGWFADPLLSSMLNYSEETLAETLIHELVHTTIWVKDSVDFNERLASYLGQKGAEVFYLKKEGPASPTYKHMQDATADDKVFSLFITAQVRELDEWYSGLSDSDKTVANKEARIKKIQDLFRSDVAPKLKTANWSKFDQAKLNNAKLMMYRTYMSDFSAFDKLWLKLNGDFAAFIEKCKTLIDSKHPDADLAKLSE
jgi:predicted aminopeptidase